MFVEVFPVFVVISVQTLLKVIITQNTFLKSNAVHDLITPGKKYFVILLVT